MANPGVEMDMVCISRRTSSIKIYESLNGNGSAGNTVCSGTVYNLLLSNIRLYTHNNL